MRLTCSPIRWDLLCRVIEGYDQRDFREIAIRNLFKLNFCKSKWVTVSIMELKTTLSEPVNISIEEYIVLILLCKNVPIDEIKGMTQGERLTWIYLFGSSDPRS